MKTSSIKRQILYILTAIFFACNPAYLSAQQTYIDPQTGIHFVDRIKPGNAANNSAKPDRKNQADSIPHFLKPPANQYNNSDFVLNPDGADLDWLQDIGKKEPVSSWRRVDLLVDQLDNLYILNSEVNLPERQNFYLSQYNAKGIKIWQDEYNGPGNADDEGSKLYVDTEGNILSIGNADNDLHLITRKHDFAGNLLWESRFSDPRNPTLHDSDQDIHNNIYQLVYLNGSAWNPGVEVLYRDTLLIHKYSGSGEFTVMIYDAMDEEGIASISHARHIGTDSLGHVYVLVTRSQAEGDDELVIRKYGPDGSLIFIKKIAEISYYYSYGFIVTQQGNIYISYASSDYSEYKYVLKYDSDGNLLWSHSAINYCGIPEKLLLAPGERILDVSRSCVICFSAEGTVLWQRSVEGGLNNAGLDTGGDVLIFFESSDSWRISKISLDDGSISWESVYADHNDGKVNNWPQFTTNSMDEIYILTSINQDNNSGIGLLVKLDPNGSVISKTRYDEKSSTIDHLEFMKINKLGQVYVFERSDGFLWIHKYTSDGRIEEKISWENISIPYDCEPVLDSRGNLYFLIHDYPDIGLIKLNPDLNVIWRKTVCDNRNGYSYYFDLNLHGESVVGYIYSDWDSETVTRELNLYKFDCNGNNTLRKIYSYEAPRLLNIRIDQYGNIYCADYQDIRKFGADGDELWQKSNGERIEKFTIDDWGYPTAVTVTYGNDIDVEVAKLLPNGNILWKYKFDQPENGGWYYLGNYSGIHCDAYGRTMLLLTTWNTPGLFAPDRSYSRELIVFTRGGNMQWSKADERFNQYPNLDINDDAAGNIYISAGFFTDQNIPFSIIKYNYYGQHSWTKSVLNGESFRYAHSRTAISENGNIFMAAEISGYTWSLVKLLKIIQTEEDNSTESISEFEIKQNFPNPFNSQTTIIYRLPYTTNVRLKLYDLNGRLIRDDDLGQRAKGEYTYFVDSRYLASGTYYYRIQTDTQIKTGKMVLVK